MCQWAKDVIICAICAIHPDTRNRDDKGGKEREGKQRKRRKNQEYVLDRKRNNIDSNYGSER